MAREPDWSSVLKYVDEGDKDAVRTCIQNHYLHLFADNHDDPVVYVTQILRWKGDSMLQALVNQGLIRLKPLIHTIHHGKCTIDELRKFRRGLGHSLSRYAELSCVEDLYTEEYWGICDHGFAFDGEGTAVDGCDYGRDALGPEVYRESSFEEDTVVDKELERTKIT